MYCGTLICCGTLIRNKNGWFSSTGLRTLGFFKQANYPFFSTFKAKIGQTIPLQKLRLNILRNTVLLLKAMMETYYLNTC